MRIAPVLLVAAGLLLAAPATASADVIFDPADADDLAAILAEAYTDQDVCYGWRVSVNDPISGISESVGSNFGAGKLVTSGSCQATVLFMAYITYTSESSEAEDSSSYSVTSNPPGVTRASLDDLGIDFGGLTGEDPDVAIGQAVTALPLLAADAGIAKPIEAAPATGEAPADAQLTDNPGSDWWRNQGGMVMWAAIVMAAGAVFAWWVLRTERRRRARRRPAYGNTLATVPPPYQPLAPEELGLPADGSKGEPPTEELPVQEPPAPEPPTEELPVQEPAVAEPFASEKEPAEEAAEQPAAEEKAAEEQAAAPAEAEPAAAEATGAVAAERESEKQATEGQAVAPSEAESSTAKATEPPVAASPESTVDKTADPEPGSPEQARPAPSDQKDKE